MLQKLGLSANAFFALARYQTMGKTGFSCEIEINKSAIRVEKIIHTLPDYGISVKTYKISAFFTSLETLSYVSDL